MQAETKKVLVGGAVALVLIIVIFAVAGRNASAPAISSDDTDAGSTPVVQPNQQPTNMPELKVVEEVKGTGAEAVAGKEVTVHYVGVLEDGTKFDSSRDRGTPFTFTLGAGEVIRGWDEGVKGMKVGGKRKLIIPSELGYGSAGFPGAIPPNATLIFDVELLGVK